MVTKVDFPILFSHYRADIVSGAERALADMVSGMDPSFASTMLVPGKGILADFYSRMKLNVWVRRIETQRRMLPGLHELQSRMMAEELVDRGFRAVVSNTFAAASRTADAARLARLPHAIIVREYVSDRPLHRQILRSSDMILAVSKDLADYLQPMAGEREVRVAYDNILPGLIDERVAGYQWLAKRLVPFDTSHPVVGWVGRITEYKQPDLFIRTIPFVLEKVPQARFVMVGQASQTEKELEQSLPSLARKLGVADKVVFLGQRGDTIELMVEFSVLCLTSIREPLPRVILEAQLVHCPVVIPNAGGVRELVIPDLTGLVFDVTAEDAPRRLADQIVRLLIDPQLNAEITDAARVEVTAGLASHEPVERMQSYLAELVERGAAHA